MTGRGPLAGCKVVEVARFVTGPFAAQLLADLGADVIKVEDPAGGDPFRGWGRDRTGGYGAPFIAFNRNKRSIALDLKQPKSLEVVRQLVAGSDVFIENFRPGVAERLGLGYSELSADNPRLVYCSITGMGTDGPYAQHPSYDGVGQGLSGLMSLLIDLGDPQPVGPTFSDTLTGLYAAYGVLAALQGRERTGRGQRIDTSLLQATMGFMHEPFASFFNSGSAPDAFSRPRSSLVFAFVCSDGLPIVIHLSKALRDFPRIMIAQVQGYCLGGAFALMNVHDLAIAADNAQIGMPEVMRGSFGQIATSTLIHSQIPIKKAAFVQLIGRNLSGVEADRLGLVSMVAPETELESTTTALAREIASRHLATLQHAKIAMQMGRELPLSTALDVDRLVGARQSLAIDPTANLKNYLSSQKGGTNLNYRREDV